MDKNSIKKRLADRNLSAVSRLSGVSRATLHRFVNEGVEPRIETMRRLVNYLETRANG